MQIKLPVRSCDLLPLQFPLSLRSFKETTIAAQSRLDRRVVSYPRKVMMNVEEELERVADRFCIDVDSIERVWEQLHEAGVRIEDFEVTLFTSFVMGHDKKELKRIKRNLGKREYQKLMKETLLHARGRVAKRIEERTQQLMNEGFSQENAERIAAEESE